MQQYGYVPYTATRSGSPPTPRHLPDEQSVQLTESHALRNRISCRALFPTLAVFILTSGLGLAVLAWLFIKCKTPLSEAFASGFILADEGVKRWGDNLESASLRALTITSFISTLVSATSPILMSLMAYRIAYLWIFEQRSQLERISGPTPLQYGLLLQVLSASSVMSLWNAIKYLFKGKSNRQRAPSYFTTAVVMGVFVYALTHLIGIADLWLHATISAVLYNITSANPTSSPLLKSLAFDESLCTEDDFPPSQRICMTTSDAWALNNKTLARTGEVIASNSSLDRIAITLAEHNDIGVVVPLSVSKLHKFKATTFGFRTTCESLNARCRTKGQGGDWYYTNCTSTGINAIPTIKDSTDFSSMVLVSPVYQWSEPVTRSAYQYGITFCCATNPISSLVEIRWSTQGDGGTQPPNDGVDTFPPPAVSVFASCSIEIYNATLMYDGTSSSPWNLVEEETVLSNNRFATTLIAPFSWQLVSDRLATNIKARTMTATSSTEVMALVNQELSRLAVGFVSSSFIFTPATDVQIITPTILGRYPIAPLLTFVVLLFLYGSTALAVFASSPTATSDYITIPSELRIKPARKDVSALELAQMRLLSPLPIVAQLYDEPISSRADFSSLDPDARSVSTVESDMFSESTIDRIKETRLRIGLEVNSSRPRFGVWKGGEDF